MSPFEIILIVIGSSFILWVLSGFLNSLTPREIRKGDVFLSEDYIQTDTPVKLNGKPDFVYKSHNNKLTVVEVKNRAKPIVYESDIIQMSTYSTILKNSVDFEKYKVNNKGILCFIQDGHKMYKKVSLFSDRKVKNLYNRYLKIITENKNPKKAKHKGLCHYCGFKKEC